MNYKSETEKYRALTNPFCYKDDGQPGVGVDIASQGDPVVPWAVQLDLPSEEFAYYNSNHPPHGPIQLRGHADKLPFDSNSLDFVYASHILEDFPDWEPVLKEWIRVLKPGGKLIILIPDRELWIKACANGQCPNDFHRHEGYLGELTTYGPRIGAVVLQDCLTARFEGDYSILGVFKKI